MILRARWLRNTIGAAIAALLAAGPASAQQPITVAKLTYVQGNVLVSRGDAMVSGANDERLTVGTRIITTAGAKGVISYDAGCDVTLSENQRFTITTGPCPVLVAQAGPAGGAIGGGTTETAGAGGGGAAMALLIVGGITAFGIYEETRKENAVSPH